jgi:transcriptional regulator with PAS, ATPase and Fis domain
MTELSDFLIDALQSLNEGLVIIDEKGIIRFCNQAYMKLTNRAIKDIIGKHIQEHNQKTRMHIVLKTGKPEINWKGENWGYFMLLSRIPIIKEKRIRGVIGIVHFQYLEELKELVQRLNLFKNKYFDSGKNDVWRPKYSLVDIIGESKVMGNTVQLALNAAKADATVLITGESGTGKELFAHAIHIESPRKFHPFVRVDCATMHRGLLEADLFGYNPGAFTGALKNGKQGKFELANQGRIFFDEIGEMPLEMQGELLRVLQEKEVVRVGGIKPIKVDFAVIAATNKDLMSMVKSGRFRQELFFRLNVINLHLPPLRERKEDIPLLIKHFIEMRKWNSSIPVILPSEILKVFMEYDWPGNVRELYNCLERLLILGLGNPLQLKEVKDLIGNQKHPSQIEDCSEFRHAINDYEANTINQFVKLANGNITKAAQLMGISRAGLYYKLKKIKQFNSQETGMNDKSQNKGRYTS